VAIKKRKVSISKRLIVIITIIIMLNFHLSIILLFPKIPGDNFIGNIRVDDTGIDIFNQTWPDISIFEDEIFVVWEDNRLTGDQKTHIYLTKSSNYGTSFGTDIRVDDAPIGDSVCCSSLAVDESNGNIYVVWQDYRNSPDPYSIDIYFANSTDGGETFNTNKRVNDDLGKTFQGVPSIASRQGFIGVVWADDRGGIYFANSTDNGNTFGENKRVNDVLGPGFFYPDIAIDDNGTVFVVWEDKIGGIFSIFFSKSYDGGNTWTPSIKVSDNPLIDGQRMPSLALDSDNNIYVVWIDYIGADTNISFARSTNRGDNFTIWKQVNDDPGIAKQYQPSIAVTDNNKIFVTWIDEREGGYNIYFANSTDGGNNFSINQKINNGPNISPVYTPSNAVKAKGNHAFIVWQDDRKGDWDIYFSRSNFEPPIASPISPINGTILNINTSILRVTSIDDLDDDKVYYNFTISDQPDAESGIVYYSGWITSTSWKPPPLSDGIWYWHVYTSDLWNITSPNWTWNFTINTTLNHGIQLQEGWNLISIPFIQLDTSLNNVLLSIDGYFDAIQWYNASDSSDSWKHYHDSKPPQWNDLGEINHTMGFWVHIIEPGGVWFEYNGLEPTDNQNITIYPGWNLLSYPSLNCYNRTDALNNIDFGTDVDAIWTFNAKTQIWVKINELDYFETGRGYWIHSKVEIVWNVPL
jgi:hypothetical protein